MLVFFYIFMIMFGIVLAIRACKPDKTSLLCETSMEEIREETLTEGLEIVRVTGLGAKRRVIEAAEIADVDYDIETINRGLLGLFGTYRILVYGSKRDMAGFNICRKDYDF